MAERGTYRHDRRQAAGRVASSIKHAGARAARMFFGASPQQKKKLRKTVDKRGVKLDDLNVNALDRSKFHAPEKVGESVRLIDIAMGNAPDGPAPDVLPAPPASPTEPARPTRRQPPPPRPARPGPAPVAPRPGPVDRGPHPDEHDDDDHDDHDDDHDEGRIGLLPALAGVLALLAFALFPTSGFLLRTRAPDVAVAGAAMRGAELDPWGNAWCATKPTPTAPAKRYSAGPDGRDDGLTRDDVDVDVAASTLAPEVVAAAAYAEEATLTLGLLFTWLAMTLGRLRAPRGGLVVELTRAGIFASLPAVLGAVVVLWSCDAAPSLGLPAPPDAIAPVGDLVREQVTPCVEPLDLPAPGATAAGWAAACLLVALLVRRSLGRPVEPG